MDKKQKKMFVSISMVFLLIVLLTGFTFAKYYSSYQAKAALEIAKWSFKVDGWSEETTTTIGLSNLQSKVDLEDGKMAPGFDGRVEIEIDASGSEVDVDYHIEADEDGHKPDNLLFKAIIDGEETTTYSTLEALAEAELKGTILRTDANKVVPITICCVWPYETGSNEEEIKMQDEEDTAVGTGTFEGKENLYDYTFSLKVVGTQAIATP